MKMRSDRVQIARKILQLFGSPYLSLKLTEQLEYWSIGMSYSGDQATVGKKARASSFSASKVKLLA